MLRHDLFELACVGELLEFLQTMSVSSQLDTSDDALPGADAVMRIAKTTVTMTIGFIFISPAGPNCRPAHKLYRPELLQVLRIAATGQF